MKIEDYLKRLPKPAYAAKEGKPIGLAVKSMERHMTDEGWQIFAGLECAGYTLCGHALEVNDTDVAAILAKTNPGVVVLQDKREWDVQPGDFREKAAKFRRVSALKDRTDVFKLTILKDSQQRPEYHRNSAEEIGCHAWICYYHPRIVSHLAPYVRSEHLVRTYHTVDTSIVPTYTPDGRNGCLLSGAVSGAYPLRQRLVKHVAELPRTHYLKHPGYHRAGSATPQFLEFLTHFKVSICTASMYGYALRKLIESTACGCVVITDLPEDEVLPEIDGNLIRVSPDASVREVADVIRFALDHYDARRQQDFAEKARAYYDYGVMGRRLADQIEVLRRAYV